MNNETLNMLESALTTGSMLAYSASFVGGLLASLTPCTYPLIPLTIGFVGSLTAGSRTRTVVLSAVYASGIAVIYALLGGVAALSGRIFGLVATHPFTNLAVGLMILLMAVSMLDLVKVPLPIFLASAKAGKRSGFVGAFFGGLCSGLVLSPCTAPVLGTLLLFVASRQNILFGMSLLFVFAGGMCTILLVIGAVTGLAVRLPRSGPWLITVKRGLALLMAGSGGYFIYEAATGFFWSFP